MHDWVVTNDAAKTSVNWHHFLVNWRHLFAIFRFDLLDDDIKRLAITLAETSRFMDAVDNGTVKKMFAADTAYTDRLYSDNNPCLNANK